MHEVVGSNLNIIHIQTFWFFQYIPGIHQVCLRTYLWPFSVPCMGKNVLIHHQHIRELIHYILCYSMVLPYRHIWVSTCIHLHTAGHDPEKIAIFKKQAVYTCIYSPFLRANWLFLEKADFLRIVTSRTCRYIQVYTQIWRNIAVPYYSIVCTLYIMVQTKDVHILYMYAPRTYKYGGGNTLCQD